MKHDALPYGVDTLVLRIEWPAPARRGYNGRMWRMRPLRGWTRGHAAGGEPSAGAEQGGDHADEGVAIPIVDRAPAVSNGGGTAPNAGGGVTNVAVAFDPNTQGVPVVLPDGSNVPDHNSPTGFLMSPYAGSGNVAERGRLTGATYFGMINSSVEPGDPGLYLGSQLALDLGHAGSFDYQRQGTPIIGYLTGFTQSRQFRDVSNFNVGLYMQQAGFTLDETLSIAGRLARRFSGNTKPKQTYGLDQQTAEFIEVGYNAGMSGVFGPSVTLSR